jgi:glutamine synthetase
MSLRQRRSSRSSFVELHGLWTDTQTKAALAVARTIKQRKLKFVRFSFVDQHGILRGKTLIARKPHAPCATA